MIRAFAPSRTRSSFGAFSSHDRVRTKTIVNNYTPPLLQSWAPPFAGFRHDLSFDLS